MLVNVKGGTGAGAQMNRKQHKDWECGCPDVVESRRVTAWRVHPGARYSCPDCGQRRPS